MSDESEFRLEFDASEARRAAAAAADVEKLADSLDHVASSARKVPLRTSLPGTGTPADTARAAASAKAWSAQWKRMAALEANGPRKGAASVAERMNASFTKFSPISRTAAKALQMFGVSGAPLRKLTVDAAKTEGALNRLFAITKKRGGGGVMGSLRGASAVTGSIWQRMSQGEGGGIRGRASSAIMGTVGGGLATAGTAAGLAVGGATVLGIGALAASMTVATVKAEGLKLAIATVAKESSVDWWSQSESYAKRFGGDVNTIAENLMQMKASQFSDAMTKDLFLRTQDMKALGTTDDAIGRMLLAIRQIKAAGKLQGDELLQLGEAGLDASFVYDVLSKKLGKSTAEIVKMKEAGKLSSDIVLPAISEAIGIKTGGKAAGVVGETAARSTVSGSMSRLQGAFSVASIEALGTDKLAPLRDGINNFTDWLNGEGGQAALSGMGNLLGKMFEYAPTLIDNVIWLLDTALPDAWDAFKTSFSSNDVNTAVWESVGDIFRELNGEDGQGTMDALSGIAATAGMTASVIATLVGGLATVAGGVMWLTQQLSDTSGWELFLFGISTLGGPVGMLTFALGELIVRGIGGGISSAASAVYDALASVISGAVSRAAAMLGSLPIVGGLFSGLGGSAADGMSQGLDRGSSDVASSAYNMGDSAYGGVVDSLDIHSPSREMGYLGHNTAAGYVNNIEAAQSWAHSAGAGLGSAAAVGAAGANMSPPVIPSVTHALTAQGGGQTVMVDAKFYVTVSAGTSPEQAQQIGAQMAQGAAPVLEAELRRLNYSTGA